MIVSIFNVSVLPGVKILHKRNKCNKRNHAETRICFSHRIIKHKPANQSYLPDSGLWSPRHNKLLLVFTSPREIHLWALEASKMNPDNLVFNNSRPPKVGRQNSNLFSEQTAFIFDRKNLPPQSLRERITTFCTLSEHLLLSHQKWTKYKSLRTNLTKQPWDLRGGKY